MVLDTSGLLCYFDRADIRHEEAAHLFDDANIRLAHNYVLTEFVPLCHSRGFPRRDTLSFADELLENSAIEMIWVDEVVHRLAMSLLQKRQDKTYSLCDAVSMVLMRQYDISTALTTDHHFEQEGFIRLLAP